MVNKCLFLDAFISDYDNRMIIEFPIDLNVI